MLQVTADPQLAQQAILLREEPCSAAKPTPVHQQRSILFLVDQLTELGGGERALFQLARALVTHGYHVSVVTFRGDPNPEAYALFPKITILHLRSCFSVEAIRVGMKLRKLIHQEAVTIVQTYFESSDIFGALVARFCGVKHIVSSRRDMGILRSSRHHVAYRLMRRCYSAVIAVSLEVRAWHLKTDRLAEQQIHVIHNGLELDRYVAPADPDKVRRAMGIEVGAPLVTTIANINVWKGLDIFLNAAAHVHRRHPDAIFVIAGDWTDVGLTAALRSQAHALGIERVVRFLGRISDVQPLLFASDVFALLSRTEGFPNVVIEAMAAGLPVVATSVGGTPEALEDAVTGFLVPNEDHQAAAACIDSLLSDLSMRIELGRAGRRRVEERFSAQQMVRKHLEVYDALV